MFTGQIGEFFLFDGTFTIDEAQSVYIQGCSSLSTNLFEDVVDLKSKKTLISLQPELYTDSLSLEGEKQWRQGTLSATYIDPLEYHRDAQTFNSLPPTSSSISIMSSAESSSLMPPCSCGGGAGALPVAALRLTLLNGCGGGVGSSSSKGSGGVLFTSPKARREPP